MSDVAHECDALADIRREAQRQRRLPLRPIRRSKLQLLAAARARTDARRFNGRPAVLALSRLDNGRPLFAVVSFEGVMSVSGDGKLYFRVGAHLLRFVLLDVDGSMPILSTPSRDSSNNHAIDDFDD